MSNIKRGTINSMEKLNVKNMKKNGRYEKLLNNLEDSNKTIISIDKTNGLKSRQASISKQNQYFVDDEG